MIGRDRKGDWRREKRTPLSPLLEASEKEGDCILSSFLLREQKRGCDSSFCLLCSDIEGRLLLWLMVTSPTLLLFCSVVQRRVSLEAATACSLSLLSLFPFSILLLLCSPPARWNRVPLGVRSLFFFFCALLLLSGTEFLWGCGNGMNESSYK
ncbi:hypothetical protein C4D60_Mb07t11960 [Musa balbisiana]|uniref:Transmembrane protein n=1 Tax=Musa balbisiana TaxID=52838 RepID=A0A4S8JEW6_MUSBA|nr:hypothetical protein C4D60_Mb07t11960 [Musa balbisiana]